MNRPRAALLLFFISVLSPPSSVLAQTTSPPPPEVVLVVCPSAYTVTKHPKLPVLYLGCYYMTDGKNLATLELSADGTVNTNSLKTFNYFCETPTNDVFRYGVQKPLVLPEERILYIAAVPSYAQFFANSNHLEIAAVALDDAGQPGKILKAIRTSHGEKEIRGWECDPLGRRLYISYHTYFGWIGLNGDMLPASDKFQLILYIQTCWQWVYAREWQRFYARQTDGGLLVFRLTPDGTALEITQSSSGPYRGTGTLATSRAFGRIYFLDTQGGRLVIHQISKDGRLTGPPRFFPLGDAVGARFDFKARRLYAWYDKAILRVFPLDERGDPVATPTLHALRCGAIRDMIVDEPTGKFYVACTESPPPPK